MLASGSETPGLLGHLTGIDEVVARRSHTAVAAEHCGGSLGPDSRT